jgi:hypothetical protein
MDKDINYFKCILKINDIKVFEKNKKCSFCYLKSKM